MNVVQTHVERCRGGRCAHPLDTWATVQASRVIDRTLDELELLVGEDALDDAATRLFEHADVLVEQIAAVSRVHRGEVELDVNGNGSTKLVMSVGDDGRIVAGSMAMAALLRAEVASAIAHRGTVSVMFDDDSSFRTWAFAASFDADGFGWLIRDVDGSGSDGH